MPHKRWKTGWRPTRISSTRRLGIPRFRGPKHRTGDRIAFAQAMDTLRRGFDTIAVATCGKYGAAMAFAARMAGLRCLICVPTRFRVGRIGEMEKYGAEILRVDADYEGTVEHSREEAERREYYDANPGGANTALQLKAYGEIAFRLECRSTKTRTIPVRRRENGSSASTISRTTAR